MTCGWIKGPLKPVCCTANPGVCCGPGCKAEKAGCTYGEGPGRALLAPPRNEEELEYMFYNLANPLRAATAGRGEKIVRMMRVFKDGVEHILVSSGSARGER